MSFETCATRTNYFKVKDPEAFKAFIARIQCQDDSSVSVMDQTKDGVKRYGFCVFDNILGIAPADYEPTDEDEEENDDDDLEYDYDEFLTGLSEHVAEGDAAIVMFSCIEGLRYVNGHAKIVTSSGFRSINLAQLAARTAREMLGDLEWETQD